MAITEKQAVAVWVERWRTLKAWGRPLDDWKVDIRMRHIGDYSTGRCWFMGKRVVVTASVDIVDSLGTILHEFAHAAAPRRADRPDENAHGLEWQRIYAAAVLEVTGRAIPEAVETYGLMDKTAYVALTAWWKDSGNEFAWKLVAAKGKR